jgi:hypothetical protein
VGEILQVVGAVLILVAFGTAQAGRLSPHSPLYLVLKLAGASVLTVVAAAEADWGFLLLEGVWTLLSLWGLVQLARGRRPADVR